MKAESTIMPDAPYTLEDLGGDICALTFYENITEMPADPGVEDATKYQYDEYRLEVSNRDGLIANIESNQSAWLQAAKNAEFETLATEARGKRDKLLTKSDKYALSDYPITEDQRDLVATYRQALRDVPEQEGFPYEIVWPVLVI